MPCGFADDWDCGYNESGRRLVCKYECKAGKRKGKSIRANCSIIGGIIGLVSKNGKEIVSKEWTSARCKGNVCEYY